MITNPVNLNPLVVVASLLPIVSSKRVVAKETMECKCKANDCPLHLKGHDGERGITQEHPLRCCSMRKPLTGASLLYPSNYGWAPAPEIDCTSLKKIALARFAREAKGAVPYRNRTGSTDSACRGAIDRLKLSLILWAGKQTWYDVNTIGKDNLHWVEDIMYAMLIRGEDASHGKLFTVAQELKGQPWCLWTGGSGAKSFAKSIG
jgi:hypothetical protein